MYTDEFDDPRPEIETLPDGRIRLPGRTIIAEINDRFGTDFSDEEADTMAGLVLGALGRPAAVGDEAVVEGISIASRLSKSYALPSFR
jgi:magnesium and cobalt transporter